MESGLNSPGRRQSRTGVSLSASACLLLFAVLSLMGCGNEAPPMGQAVTGRDSLPVMITRGVSKLISDSGVVRYKIVAEEWHVFDKTNPPRQVFPKGIFLERYDDDFRVNLHIVADTAYCYNQNLWELRGRVFIENEENGTTFSTELLYWNMNEHRLYSDRHMHIVTPDRDLQGDWFVSNEQMTKYEIRQSKGFMPVPNDRTAAPPAGENDSVPMRDAPVKQGRYP